MYHLNTSAKMPPFSGLFQGHHVKKWHSPDFFRGKLNEDFPKLQSFLKNQQESLYTFT